VKNVEIRKAARDDALDIQGLFRQDEDFHRLLYPQYFAEQSAEVPLETIDEEIVAPDSIYFLATEEDRVVGIIHAKKKSFSKAQRKDNSGTSSL